MNWYIILAMISGVITGIGVDYETYSLKIAGIIGIVCFSLQFIFHV